MFNFFKRKFKKRNQNFSDKDYFLLKQIVEKLPAEYSFLKNQMNSDFILGYYPWPHFAKDGKKLILNRNLLNNSFKDGFSPFLSNIIVNYNIEGQKKHIHISLDIADGTLITLYMPDDYRDCDFESINTEQLSVKNGAYPISRKRVKELIGRVDEDLLNLVHWQTVYEIEEGEKSYYTIWDLGNGDYYSIDENRKVYAMFHDPFTLHIIYENVLDFLKDVLSGEFDPEKYLDEYIPEQ